jgi:CcmD family protein
MTAFATAYLIVSFALMSYLVRLGARQRHMLRAWHQQTTLAGGDLSPHFPARQQEHARCG